MILKEIMQTILSYALHSLFVRKIMKVWASSNKATPHNWLQLISAVLEIKPDATEMLMVKRGKIFRMTRKSKRFLGFPRSNSL